MINKMNTEEINKLTHRIIGCAMEVHKVQAINYCEAYHVADGLLINFGAERLQYHRVFNKKLKSQTS